MLAGAQAQSPNPHQLKMQGDVLWRSGFSPEHIWEEGDFLEVCLVSYPKGCKSSRQSAWQQKVKPGERVTHVLQAGQVEPLCTTVELSMIFVNLTACWKLKPRFPLFCNDPSQTRGRSLQEGLAASQELAWSTS